jgi:hypothetical protein
MLDRFLSHVTDRRTFIGRLSKKIVAFAGAVLLPTKLLAACNCGSGYPQCPDCCLCNPPWTDCQLYCLEQMQCSWVWGNGCYECLQWPQDCYNYTDFDCDWCVYTTCSNC